MILFVFLILFINGFLLGLSDDEAYYWVLAQNPSWGFAYHPPAVVWLIALFQKLFFSIFGHSPILVRLPAIFSTTLVFYLAMRWFHQIGLPLAYLRRRRRAALVLLSFCGYFPLGWMMVPDAPLFLGWMLLFVGTYSVCFQGIFQEKKNLFFIALGAFVLVLSKYSSILSLFSSLLCLLKWGKGQSQRKAMIALVVAAAVGMVPVFLWNQNHHWASLLYQIKDRHSGSSFSFYISILRYLKFLLIGSICAGPFILGLTFCSCRDFFIKRLDSLHQKQIFQFIARWVVPSALVFCIQPFFADFKPHWAFVVWWPLFLWMAWISSGTAWRWIRYQVVYGLSVGVFIIISCHFPIISIFSAWGFGIYLDPKLDVTNDLYGWQELPSFIKSRFAGKDFVSLGLPLIGSRYQTASQAAFSLNASQWVGLIPRDSKQMQEWPDLKVSDTQGPLWPSLSASVFYIADNRYQEGPHFLNAQCVKLSQLESFRFGFLAKSMTLWQCDPKKEILDP